MKFAPRANKVVLVLRTLAVLSAVAIIACWLSLGAHMGWSQTRVPIEKADPVTEMTFSDYEERFLPGLDFLAAGLLGCAAIFALTFLVPRSERKRP
jgi:hypothetical protein